MKMRVTAILLTVMVCLALVVCNAEANMSATTRAQDDGDGIMYIDDEAIALAGSMQTGEMTEQEKARVGELRAMAVETFDLMNVERAEAGLPALEWDDELEACAQVRAIEIQTKFSHTRPNGSDWYTVNSDLMWGENLAKGYKDSSSLMKAWMNSPSHAANILDSEFETCGIAIYEADGRLYYAQEFGFR